MMVKNKKKVVHVPTEKHNKKHRLSWEVFEADMANLAEQIDVKELNITHVTGIPRGGLVIAIKLSHLLGLEYVAFNPISMQVPRGRILVCDDVSDSGHTMKTVVREHPDMVVTLCWTKKSKTIFNPDFCMRNYKDTTWLVFPWEVE